MAKPLIDQRAQGAVVLERFAKLSQVPETLVPHVDHFRAVHAKLEAAALAVDEARMARDGALDAAATADSALDLAVEKLAAALVGAGLGKRTAPLAGFSKLTPSQLTRQAYLTEVKHVRELAAKVAAKGPPQEVTRIVGDCLQHAAAVEAGLTALSGPQAEMDRKIAARDQAAMDWSKAYGKLKLRAEVEFEEEPGPFRSLFAKPEAVQRPTKRRKKDSTQPPA